jgi:hypothetical protein
MCRLLLIITTLFVATFANAQDVDPLAAMQGLLRQHLQEDAQYRQNERMLLELQRLEHDSLRIAGCVLMRVPSS